MSSFANQSRGYSKSNTRTSFFLYRFTFFFDEDLEGDVLDFSCVAVGLGFTVERPFLRRFLRFFDFLVFLSRRPCRLEDDRDDLRI